MGDKVEEADVSVSWQRFCGYINYQNTKFQGHCILLLSIQWHRF